MKETALEMCREIVDKQHIVLPPIFPVATPAIDPADNKCIEYTEDGPRMRLDAEPPPRNKWTP